MNTTSSYALAVAFVTTFTLKYALSQRVRTKCCLKLCPSYGRVKLKFTGSLCHGPCALELGAILVGIFVGFCSHIQRSMVQGYLISRSWSVSIPARIKSSPLYFIHDFFMTLQYTYVYFIVHSRFRLHTPRHWLPLSICLTYLLSIFMPKPALCCTWGILPRGRKSTNALWPSKVTSVVWLSTTTAHLQWMGLLYGWTANI
jgi:hypothetical protein